ncbi:hypothetical protein ACHAXS_000224 [Conticribra weissflogii]
MLKASNFNQNDKDNYVPSWMIILMKALPHPSSIEYHYIADDDQERLVMWQIKLKEGKDHPVNTIKMPFYSTKLESHTKTLHMCCK